MFDKHSYQLKFVDESGVTDVEFEAEDAFKALVVAHEKATDGSAELWRDGQKLCSIRRGQREVWEIQPAQSRRAGAAA